MTIDAASAIVAAAPKKGSRHPAVVSLLWGNGIGLVGVAVVVLLALPARPGPDAEDVWAELGWVLITGLIAAVVGVIGAAIGTYLGLRRSGTPKAGMTALVYVPTALVCGALTAGLGALVAPAVAWWMVDGFRGGRPKPAAPTGYGPPPPTPVERAGWRGGLAQRLVLTAVVCVGATAWVLNHFGYELGGELHGELYVWATCVPVLVVVPVLLLRRHVPALHLLAGIVVVIGLAGTQVPSAVEAAHPSAARLERLALDLPVPAGQQVAEYYSAGVATLLDETQPAMILVSVPNGSAAPPLPSALTSLADGSLPREWTSLNPSPLPASEAGERAADMWEQVLLDEGWEVDEYTTSAYDDGAGPHWLPRRAAHLVEATDRVSYEHGPWVRASVLPYNDGALIVVAVRP